MSNKPANQKRVQNEIEHFSKMDHVWWGAKTKSGQKRYDYKLEKLIEYCHPTIGVKILEIGCGDGEFTKRLTKLKCKITATDVTPALIKRGRKVIKNKKINFLVDNAEKMRFAKESFDLVCGISILHHIDYQKTLKETYRVLKKDGQLFFTEPNLVNPIIWAGLNVDYLRKRMEFSLDETALMKRQMEKLLKKIGFKEYKVVNYDFIHPSIPFYLTEKAEKVSKILEQFPLLKELSGSLIIWARK